MPINFSDIANKMIEGAISSAGGSWNKIRQAATVEFNGMAQRLALIAEAYQRKEMTKTMVQRHFRTIRYHVISTIAMLTVLLEAAVEKIVNGALTVARDAVNQALGFKLIA